MDVRAHEPRARLDACLLDEDAYAQGPFEWAALPDPFPAWDPIDHHEGHG